MSIRMTLTAAMAVVLASFSVYPLIQGWGWFFAGLGAVLVVAAAGLLTRLAPVPATVAGCVLAVIACLPLLAIPTWYSRVGAAAIVAVAAAGLTQHRRLAPLTWLITYLAALLIYLNAAFAAGQSLAGFLPTRASLHHLGALVSGGLDERSLAPPVPGIHGIVLVAGAGIGLMALATDLLAVRLRSPAIAGLPLLALFSVPITTNARQGGFGATMVFCLGIIGYLALLAADGRDRLRIWGRLVTVWQYREAEAIQGPDTRALAASGRRIGLAAISIAILLPLFIPGISVHGLFGGQAKLGGGGKTRVSLPDPIAQMQAQLQETNAQTVLTYTSSAASATDQYLQVYVLNYSSSNGQWSLVTPGASTVIGSKPLRPAPGTSARQPQASTRLQVKMDSNVIGYGSKLSFLPVPYAPASLRVDGQWAEDNSTLMVYSTKTALGGLAYTVNSKTAVPTSQQLELSAGPTVAAVNDYLAEPNTDQEKLFKIATAITKGARSNFEKALDLQQYFHDNALFKYSLNVHLPQTTAGLLTFLTKTRTGFCQQYAIAMATLARMVGIPSRIAIGYTAGSSLGNGSWRVTTSDAHAWPELYLPGVGWLRFEPTPSGADGQQTAVAPAYASISPGGPGSPTGPRPGGADTLPTTPGGPNNGQTSKLNRLSAAEDARNSGAASQAKSSFPYGWIILIVVVLALAAPASSRQLVRRARWRRAAGDAGLAAAAWRELRDDLADHGMAGRPSETPRATARRLGATLSLDDHAQQALDRMARAEERARYASTPQSSPALRADADTVRRAISSEADPVMRWRARLLPASTLEPTRAAVQNALDVFGWMDAAGLRMRNSRLGRRARFAGEPGQARQVLG